MSGLFGDLRNLAQNPGFELWYQQTIASTSQGFVGDKWLLDLGTGSTCIASRASTGQALGDFCAGISYTHAATSGFHQVVNVSAFKGQRISFGIRVATATAGACRPYIAISGVFTYGNYNTGQGDSTYEQLKVEGVLVPTTATGIWIGVEFGKSATMLFDVAVLNLGSAIDTEPGPMTGGSSAAWTMTSGATVRSIDMTLAVPSGSTLPMQILGTLVRDLQALGILS